MLLLMEACVVVAALRAMRRNASFRILRKFRNSPAGELITSSFTDIPLLTSSSSSPHYFLMYQVTLSFSAI
jgi:hypothetical protein